MRSAIKKFVKSSNFKLLSIPVYGFNTSKLVQEKLFTPGPLLTTETVKLSMNFDYGSRDPQFIKLVRDVRYDLLKIAHVSPEDYTTIIMQGSGTFGVESVLQTAIPKKNSKILIVTNGAYGERMAKIANLIGLSNVQLNYKDNEAIKPDQVIEKLKNDSFITHVGIIHSETTSGIINPIQQLGNQMKRFCPNVSLIVDAMSSFGAYDIDIKNWGIDYLVSSSNKNLQGVPGFSFIIANLKKFGSCEGNSTSLALDAFDQWRGLEKNGQFRFTPPTHVIKAFKTALDEFKERGGVEARNRRYIGNQKYIAKRLKNMGFKLYLDPAIQGCIITTFLQPTHSNWNFEDFYNYLSARKQIIYPGKLTQADSFRIGSIGELSMDDFALLGTSIEQYLREKKIPIPLQYT